MKMLLKYKETQGYFTVYLLFYGDKYNFVDRNF